MSASDIRDYKEGDELNDFFMYNIPNPAPVPTLRGYTAFNKILIGERAGFKIGPPLNDEGNVSLEDITLSTGIYVKTRTPGQTVARSVTLDRALEELSLLLE